MNRAPLTSIHTTATGRLGVTTEQDAALERDIRERGILEPVLLSPRTDGTYDVIAGNRRVKIARKIGLTDIPYAEHRADDTYREGTRSNLLHAPLRDIEIADYVLQEFTGKHSVPGKEPLAVLAAIRKDPSSDPDAVRVLTRITRDAGLGPWEDYLPTLLKLYTLPEDIIQPLRDAAVTSAQAAVLKSVKDPTERTKLVQRAQEESLSVKELRTEVKERSLNVKPDKAEKPDKPDKAEKAPAPPNPVIESAKQQVLDLASRELSDTDREKVRKILSQLDMIFGKKRK